MQSISFQRDMIAVCVLALGLATGCAGGAAEQPAPPAPEPAAVDTMAADTVPAPEPPPADTALPPDTVVAEPEPVPEADTPADLADVVETLPGAVLPHRRIVAFYGNPLSTRMGILGELPPEQMLARLDQEVAAWRAADPGTPVQPALHVIAVLAAADSGADGKYRVRLPDHAIERVLSWAERRDALVFLDIQPGRSSVQAELPRLRPYLERPDVHLALDPEWAMRPDQIPGRSIGTLDAADVNHAVEFLAGLVEEYDLPPKILVVHRFTQGMLTNVDRIRRDPRVQVVLHMDGWGPPATKVATYRSFVANEPVPYKGFKLFYRNDTRSGAPLMTPESVLGLSPRPTYIQYQ